ncbi:MAG: ABC-2 family transporter protein, partial [Lachnospiraceae bacterium]|nr:ABC-2 family transporter protein [Lachnospiraceae bacterium]
MEFIKIYIFYIKKFFQARAEYRLSFWIGILANFITYFLAYISYWIITGQLSDIAGWDFSELCLLYGMSLLTYAIAGTLLWYSVYNLSGMIIRGTLDIFLTRPMGILRQLICNRFGDTFLAQIFVTFIFIAIATAGRLDGMNAWKIFYFILAVIGGTCIQAGGMIAIGALSFWTMKSEEVGDIFY